MARFGGSCRPEERNADEADLGECSKGEREKERKRKRLRYKIDKERGERERWKDEAVLHEVLKGLQEVKEWKNIDK